MAHDLIRVQPARHLRQEFARWAVQQRPKLRTVSEAAFGVPPRLYTDMPERLLIGALVDGRPYVPVDDEPSPAAPAGAPELLGVAPPAPEGSRLLACGLCYEEAGEEVHPHPECTRGAADGLREAVPGQPLPEVPEEAYGPGTVPVDFAPLEDAPTLEAGELVLVGEDGPETHVPARETRGDTAGDSPASGEDTTGSALVVTSEDTGDGSGDTAGDSPGDTSRPYRCGACPRSFKTERGRDSHRRQAHGR
ncbi:hypothetical protein ACPCK3_14785 [Streptomyces griseoincarnatus]